MAKCEHEFSGRSLTEQATVVRRPAAGRRSLADAVVVLVVLAAVSVEMNRYASAVVYAGQSSVPQQAGDVAELEASVQQAPTAANRIRLSLAYSNNGEAARAIPVLLSVVADDKTNLAAWNDLCVLHTLQQDYAIAIDECNQALTIDPSFQLARNNLRWASGEEQKMFATIANAKRLTVVRDADFFLKQGLNEMHVGDYDQAIESWKQMLLLEPKSSWAANNIGVAFMLKGHPEQAVGWFDKAVVLEPGFQMAKNNLAWAQQELRVGVRANYSR